MDIETRGKPPYKVVSSDFMNTSFIFKGHAAIRDSYKEALKLIFDLTDGGQFLPQSSEIKGARIIDSIGEIVFTIDRKQDVAILRALDDEGLDKL